MKTIPLTRGLSAKVSDEDYPYLSQFKWQAVLCDNKFYARRSVRQGKKMTYVIMHRLITNAPDGLVVDHKNHDTLDNTRENLRVVTQPQNLRNRSKNKFFPDQQKAIENGTIPFAVITLRHSKAMKARLEQLAKSAQIPLSRLLRELIDEGLEHRKENNSFCS